MADRGHSFFFKKNLTKKYKKNHSHGRWGPLFFFQENSKKIMADEGHCFFFKKKHKQKTWSWPRRAIVFVFFQINHAHGLWGPLFFVFFNKKTWSWPRRAIVFFNKKTWSWPMRAIVLFFQKNHTHRDCQSVAWNQSPSRWSVLAEGARCLGRDNS